MPEMLVTELSRRLDEGALNESHGELGLQSVDLVDRVPMLTHSDFVKMDSSQLDRFLDRCEHVLLRDRPLLNGTSTREHCLDPKLTLDPVFPLPSSTAVPAFGADEGASWRDFHASAENISHRTIPANTPNKDLPLLPGEAIRSYNSRDLTGTLPAPYEVILRAAAEVVGVRERDMARLVELIEMKLYKAKAKRRGSNASEQRSRPNSRPGSRPNSRPPSRAGSAAPSRATSMSRGNRRKSALVD
jgi:hypothetical protein